MSSERIGQIEYDIGSNIKVNLKTGRLLFNTNIINIFKDEYNLNLNLIYNSNNNFNPNMDSLLGNYFKLDISEYIQRTGNLIYYIDSFDRYNLAETYYSNQAETHKHFNNESGLTLIVYNDNDNKILIKDDNGNTKEYSKLYNQSDNTYYYVLTKKNIKLNDNSYLIYYYNYNNDNKLISINNNIDENRKILFDYENNKISRIYNIYNNVINGVKLKYNSNNQIIAILEIINSISTLNYLFIYNSNKLNYLINNIDKKTYEFTYSNNMISYIRQGVSSYKIIEDCDLYTSEIANASNQDFEMYTREYENYNVMNIVFTSYREKSFTYNAPTAYTLIEDINPFNSLFNNKTIYYYDNKGVQTSQFEVIDNSIQYLKDVSIMRGIDLLGTSQEFNNVMINNKFAFFRDTNNNYSVSYDGLTSFISYHNDNVNKYDCDSLPYKLECFFSFHTVRCDNYLKITILYSDDEIEEHKLLLTFKATTGLWRFSSTINVKAKEVASIIYNIISPVNSTYYITNMYWSMSTKEELIVSDGSFYTTLNYELYITVKDENDVITNYSLQNGYYMSANDLFYTLEGIRQSENEGNTLFKLRMNDGKYLLYIKKAWLVVYNPNYNPSFEDPEVEMNIDSNLNFHIKTIDYCTNKKINRVIRLISRYGLKYYCQEEYRTMNVNKIVLYDSLHRILEETSEDNLIKHYTRDFYGRVVYQTAYYNNTIKEQISCSYNELTTICFDNFLYNKKIYDEFGILSSNGIKSIYDDNYSYNYYKYDKRNNIRIVSNTNNLNKQNNYTRINSKGMQFQYYYKSNNNIINHFFEYDCFNRLIAYYRINGFKKNASHYPLISYIYDDEFNVVYENIRYNNNNHDISEYKYDKKNRLIHKKINNSFILINSYDSLTDRLVNVVDNSNNIQTSYSYDNDGNLKSIIEMNSNHELIRKKEFINRKNKKEIIEIIGNVLYLDTIYHYDNTRVEPRLTYLENDYLKSTYTYNILNKIKSKTIGYWDQHLWEPFSFSKTIDYSYLVSSTIETNIIDEITVHYYRDGGCLGLIYKINNDYTGLTGKLENYSILLKTDDNTFINKTAYSYNYYSTEELQKEKIKRFNNNDDVIFYKEINYLYDYSGNITSKNIKIGVNEYSITSNVTDIYQYSFDRLIRIDTNNSFKTFTYDDYGNIIEVDFYNNNQLIKKELFSYVLKTKISEYIVKDSNNIIVKHYKYYYDGFENRYKKEDLINNTIINYHYLDNKLLCQSNDLIFLYDGDELIGFNYNNRSYSYLKDDVGNIISIVIESIDGESIEVARYEYDGYGNVTVYSYDSNDSLVVNSNDSFIGNINPYRYKGYYYDVETCLYYLQSRYYCSDIGRFISPESIDCIDFKIINGLNLYCYSNNEPINGAKKKSNESIDYSEFNIEGLRFRNYSNEITKNDNYYNPHWKYEYYNLEASRPLSINKDGINLISVGFYLYKASYCFDNDETESLYLSIGNASMTLGLNLKDGIGVDASLTAFSVGVNYSFIDVSFNFFSIGASCIFKEKRVKVSFSEIFGLEISVDLKELWKYLNEEED